MPSVGLEDGVVGGASESCEKGERRLLCCCVVVPLAPQSAQCLFSGSLASCNTAFLLRSPSLIVTPVPKLLMVNTQATLGCVSQYFGELLRRESVWAMALPPPAVCLFQNLLSPLTQSLTD